MGRVRLEVEGAAARVELHEHYREQLQKYAKALLAHPHKELGVQATVDEALLDVPHGLREGLAELLELGAPEPALDVAWEERKVALIVEVAEADVAALAALAAEGWKIARQMSELRSLLGFEAAAAEDG